MNTKKDIFQKHKNQNQKKYSHKPSANPQRINNPKKSVAVNFKDVKTQETFSSQDQKLVETINLRQHFFRTKNQHSENLFLQRSLNQ